MLRDPRPADAAPYAQAFADDPTLSHALGFPALTRRDARRRLAGETRNRARGDSIRLVISDVAGAFHGLIRLHSIRSRTAQVGFMVVRAARRRGLALESLRLLVGWAFATLGLERVGLATLPDNVATQRLAERAGFVRRPDVAGEHAYEARAGDAAWA